ncbi:hypothetical protein FACS18948_6460 [Clostridia bacterium]|nr:hypothetical protein FACS18948_6460 [Clostridia bacterium]
MAREWHPIDVEQTEKGKADITRAAQWSIRMEKANGIVQVAKSLRFAVRGRCDGDSVRLIVETLQRQLDSLIQHYAKSSGNVAPLPYSVHEYEADKADEGETDGDASDD